MNEFIITEDFPMNQKEFDERFCTEEACYEYLFRVPNFVIYFKNNLWVTLGATAFTLTASALIVVPVVTLFSFVQKYLI